MLQRSAGALGEGKEAQCVWQYTRAEIALRGTLSGAHRARKKASSATNRIAAPALMRCTPDLLRLAPSATTVCAWRIQLWKFEVVASSS
jgi:hypothetical protein